MLIWIQDQIQLHPAVLQFCKKTKLESYVYLQFGLTFRCIFNLCVSFYINRRLFVNKNTFIESVGMCFEKRYVYATFCWPHQEPCETSRALEAFIGFQTKASAYIGPVNPGYCDAASMLSKGWNKVGGSGVSEESYAGEALILHFPQRTLCFFSSPGIVSLELWGKRLGWCWESPHLCLVHHEAHSGPVQCHELLQVGPHRRHLFFWRHLGGDGHQGVNVVPDPLPGFSFSPLVYLSLSLSGGWFLEESWSPSQTG